MLIIELFISEKKINSNEYLHVSKFLNSTMNSLINIFPIYVLNIYFYIFYITFRWIKKSSNLLYTITSSKHHWKC